LRHLGTIRTGKLRGHSPGASGNHGTVAIEDFDPIFRRKDFTQVQKNVYNMVNLKKNFSAQQYNEMREEVHERLRKKTDQEQFDQDQFDFLQSDPRIVSQDNEQK
jgi:hypothetical protein